MSRFLRRLLATAVLASLAASASAVASPGDALRDKLLATYAKIRSYKITVLGSVRSSGVFVAPDRYSMSTVLEGKPVKTVFAGASYWILSNGKWAKSDNSGDNLRFDITGLLRTVKSSHSPLQTMPDAAMNGHKVGVFAYTFKNDGTHETCNYDLRTYEVVRCKTDQLTVLYSGFNDPSNQVKIPK